MALKMRRSFLVISFLLLSANLSCTIAQKSEKGIFEKEDVQKTQVPDSLKQLARKLTALKSGVEKEDDKAKRLAREEQEILPPSSMELLNHLNKHTKVSPSSPSSSTASSFSASSSPSLQDFPHLLASAIPSSPTSSSSSFPSSLTSQLSSKSSKSVINQQVPKNSLLSAQSPKSRDAAASKKKHTAFPSSSSSFAGVPHPAAAAMHLPADGGGGLEEPGNSSSDDAEEDDEEDGEDRALYHNHHNQEGAAQQEDANLEDEDLERPRSARPFHKMPTMNLINLARPSSSATRRKMRVRRPAVRNRDEMVAANNQNNQQQQSNNNNNQDDGTGEIVYEDELPNELSDWMPPPPPPPPEGVLRPLRGFPGGSSTQLVQSTSGFGSGLGGSVFKRGNLNTGARLFGDDFALFLVILTIAGFFGLMLAMFMPFTFMLNQQQSPLGGINGLGGYPNAVFAGNPGALVGYPYGKRRRRRKRWTDEIMEERFQRSLGILLKALGREADYYLRPQSSRRRKRFF